MWSPGGLYLKQWQVRGALPQSIPIREKLAETAAVLEGFLPSPPGLWWAGGWAWAEKRTPKEEVREEQAP